MELLILDKKERGAESQYYSGESVESRGQPGDRLFHRTGINSVMLGEYQNSDPI